MDSVTLLLALSTFFSLFSLLAVLLLCSQRRGSGEKISGELEEAFNQARLEGDRRSVFLNNGLKDLKEELLSQINRNSLSQGESLIHQLTLSGQRLEALERRSAEDAARLREEQGRHLAGQTETLRERLEGFRSVMEESLDRIREDNARQLEKMRQTVDEKLQGSLEKKLNQSFALVCSQLDMVSKGLGEMRSLAVSVGDLQHVLSNVKIRGTWGEFQLANILSELLTPSQYEAQVHVVPTSSKVVEFAIRLPGHDNAPLWLPIDSKFPKEDYERLQEAAERADKPGVEQALKDLGKALKKSASDIASKYIVPPFTTDFALLFLPTEGLYSEALRIPGLADTIQREFHVCLVGPTTLSALLNSLQMGFRTLALQKRSVEVWQVLGGVKSEFAKFQDIFEKVQKKIIEVERTLADAQTKTRTMQKKLKSVSELPEGGDPLPEEIAS